MKNAEEYDNEFPAPLHAPTNKRLAFIKKIQNETLEEMAALLEKTADELWQPNNSEYECGRYNTMLRIAEVIRERKTYV